ncbi:glutathione S-transferase [Trichoderma ceciliae]
MYGTDEQRESWFLRLNPNSRIPILLDVSAAGSVNSVIESQAILTYLQENYDAAHYFQKAMLRIYSVLESHLSGQHRGDPATTRGYLAGDGVGKYSIADMGDWPNVRGYRPLGFSEENNMRPKFPHLLQCVDRIAARTAVQRGIDAEKYDSEENPGLLARAE